MALLQSRWNGVGNSCQGIPAEVEVLQGGKRGELPDLLPVFKRVIVELQGDEGLEDPWTVPIGGSGGGGGGGGGGDGQGRRRGGGELHGGDAVSGEVELMEGGEAGEEGIDLLPLGLAVVNGEDLEKGEGLGGEEGQGLGEGGRGEAVAADVKAGELW